ncbi:MAG: Crp/Fnr family transcriptional regulator [Chitinophagales bacterium]
MNAQAGFLSKNSSTYNFKDLLADSFNGVHAPTIQKVTKGGFIYLPNKLNTNIYIIKSGRVKIGAFSDGGKEFIKLVLNDGELFGELTLSGTDHRNEYAQAMEDTYLYVIPIRYVKNKMRTNWELNIQLTQLMADRLILMQQRLERQVFRDTKTRVVAFMLDLIEKRGKRVGFEWLIFKFFTHQEIACMTGTSRQTVTSIINELKGENLIYCNKRRLLVRDREKLSAMVNK